MRKACLFLVFLVAASVGSAADWKQIYVNKDGVKWYASNAVHLEDGSLRVLVKATRPKRDRTPIAINLRCDTDEVRNFVAGASGSEVLQPWKPITPDSVGGFAANAFCKNRFVCGTYLDRIPISESPE